MGGRILPGTVLRILLAAVLAGSVPLARAQGLFDDNEARRRIQVLRADFEQSQKQVQDQLARIEAAVQDKSALVELSRLIDGLKQDIAKLNGQSEVALNRAENLERRQKDLYVDLDSRLRKIEDAQGHFPAQWDPKLGIHVT